MQTFCPGEVPDRGGRLAGAVAYLGGVGTRNVHAGCHVGRNLDTEGEQLAGLFPTGPDRPTDRPVGTAGPVQSAAGMWPEQQLPEAGGTWFLIDAQDVPVEPFADRAQRVMVERIHPGGLEPVFFAPAVPALPDG